MVAVGSTLSGFWIIVANSWQQTPAGFEIVEGRAVLTDFMAAVFNPSTVPRYLHTIDAALICGSFLVMGLSARYLLRGEHKEFAQRSLKAGLALAFVGVWLQWPLGHYHAVQVAETQPAKLAAFEGHWETGPNAPLLVFGIPNPEEERTDAALALPSVLSIGVGGSADTVVQGLKDFPKEDRPPIHISFWSFHIMVGFGCWFSWLTLCGVYLLWRKKIFEHRFFLKMAYWSLPLPLVSTELGWVAAEVGRQPWIVQGLLRTKDAVSEVVPAAQILASLLMFVVVYALLFAVWIFVIRRILEKGPEPAPASLAAEEVAS